MDLLKSLHCSSCNLLIVISAPSGAGKSSICRHIREKINNLEYSISFTTRDPRQGEVNGEDYYFITQSEFKEMIRNNEFAEWELVHDNFYGTAKREIAKALNIHHDLLLDIDVKGAKKLKELYPKAVYIYIFPPSLRDLKIRLEKRMTESTEQIKRRFSTALMELAYFTEYDYLIFNEKLNVAVNQIKKIIEVEKYRINRIADREELKKKITNLSM